MQRKYCELPTTRLNQKIESRSCSWERQTHWRR